MVSAISAVMLSSCAIETEQIPQEELFTRNFIKEFGIINSDHPWTMIESVSVDIDDFNDRSKSVSKIRIYSDMPHRRGAVLLAEQPVGIPSFKFDCVSGQKYVYASFVDANGCELALRPVSIYGNTAKISRVVSRPSTDEPLPGKPVLSEPLRGTRDFNYLQRHSGKEDQLMKPSDIFNAYRILRESHNDGESGILYDNLDNGQWIDGISFNVSDIFPLVGKDGVFHEQLDSEGKCNYQKYKHLFNIDKRKEFVIAEEGYVSIDFLFGGTGNKNQFGYFYYTDAEKGDIDAIAKRPRYILIHNGAPEKNMKVRFDANGSFNNLEHGNKGPEYVENYDKDKNDNKEFLSRRYFLVYFGEDGKSEASYTFPEGTHIGFFIYRNGYSYYYDERKEGGNYGDQNSENMTISKMQYEYSLPMLNDYFDIWNSKSVEGVETPGQFCKDHGYSEEKIEPFVSFKYNGYIYIGCEDGGHDDDMNDILFRFNAKLRNEEDIKDVEKPIVEEAKWIVACEDLGGTYDFDFNDMVFGVQRIDSTDPKTQKTETILKVKALASGGVLPIYLYSKYKMKDSNESADADGYYLLKPVCSEIGEFHSWFGTAAIYPINVDGYSDIGEEVEVIVPEGTKFSMMDFLTSNNAGKPGQNVNDLDGFKIVVEQSNGKTTEIRMPDRNGDIAPQMIVMPGSWQWTREKIGIHEAYSGFLNWANGDGSVEPEWWTTSKDGHTVPHNYVTK